MAERSWRPGSYTLIKSLMYTDAILWTACNVNTSTLCSIRYLIGSQCSAIRTGVNYDVVAAPLSHYQARCRILRHLEFVYQPLVDAKQHRITVIQIWCYECMHGCLACIDSQSMSNLGYVVQLEVSTLIHAWNFGRHIHATIQENTYVSYGLLERYVTSTHMLLSVMAGVTLQLGTLKAIASVFDSFSSSWWSVKCVLFL